MRYFTNDAQPRLSRRHLTHVIQLPKDIHSEISTICCERKRLWIFAYGAVGSNELYSGVLAR